jgi:glucose-1-phosphate thymidylyltransferase
MIGVIPAAGKGTRLGRGVKALMKLRGRHLIEYPIGNMKNMGIEEVIIVESGDSVSCVLGSEVNGVQLSYVEQTEQKGIAHAISLTEPNVGREDIFIILGDVVYVGADLQGMKARFNWIKEGNYVFYGIKRVSNQNLIKRSYGFELRLGCTAIKIIEKPKKVKHLMPFIGLGIYVATHRLYRAIEMTAPSSLRDEVEITDTLNLMSQALRATGHILGGMYANINTSIDLEQVKEYMEKKRR